jgi:hypothetical protein
VAAEVAVVTLAEVAEVQDPVAVELETAVIQVVTEVQTLVVVADHIMETVPEDTVVQDFV